MNNSRKSEYDFINAVGGKYSISNSRSSTFTGQYRSANVAVRYKTVNDTTLNIDLGRSQLKENGWNKPMFSEWTRLVRMWWQLQRFSNSGCFKANVKEFQIKNIYSLSYEILAVLYFLLIFSFAYPTDRLWTICLIVEKYMHSFMSNIDCCNTSGIELCGFVPSSQELFVPEPTLKISTRFSQTPSVRHLHQIYLPYRRCSVGEKVHDRFL